MPRPPAHPFAALVTPAVVKAAAEHAAQLDLPRRICKAWSGSAHDLDDTELDDEQLDNIDRE